MFFAGSKLRETLLFAAISRDGFAWEMLGDGRAIIHPGSGSNFDAETTYHPAVLRIDRRLRVWYMGTFQENENWIGGSDTGAKRRGRNTLRIELAEAQIE